MSEKNIKFGDEKVNKRSFYKNKKLFKMEGININKILVSKKEPYGKNSFKYFIGYDDEDGIRSLRISFLKYLDMLNIRMIIAKIVRECLLRLVIKNC